MSDCKIKLSIRGGSGRSIQDFSYCPQLFKHKMDGVFFKLTPTYYVSGRIIHENIEAMVNAKLQGNSPKIIGEDELTEIFEKGEYVTAGMEESTIFTPDKKPIKFIPKILSSVNDMLESGIFGKIKASEAYYQGPLVDPETLEVNKELEEEGVIFAGKVDLISERENHVTITDFKSCKSALKQADADSSTQLTNYSYLYMIEHREIANHVALAFFTKHTRDETQSGYLESVRHFNNYIALYDNLSCIGKEVSACIDADRYQKKGMIRDCKDTFNQLCPYHPMCFREQYSDDEIKEFDSHLRETDVEKF